MTRLKKVRRLLSSIGPGFITGASDDDPSGIATYSQTGAQFGFSQLWTCLFTLPFMIAVQEMCGRIGLVTGQGLSGVIKKYYGRPLLYGAVALLLIANTINIGADLGAMASAAGLLVPLPFIVLLIGATILTLVLEIFVSYHVYVKYLKYLALSLLAYGLAVAVINQDWLQIARSTVLPHVVWSKEYVLNIVALLGTTISPYLFFWQADEEVEEEIDHHKISDFGSALPRVTKKDVRRMNQDTVIGMLFSNVITFFIIVTAASTLGVHGITNITTATEAAEALRPIAGNFAFLLFAVGIIGTGLLTVPVLAGSASYAIAEAAGWKSGLYRKLAEAHGFYGVITIATLVGLLVNFTGIPPFKMLYYTAVLNGVVAPPLLILILCIANNKKIMGQFTNSRTANFLGILVTVVMSLAGGALIVSYFR
jgi:NRAMP (natural resistance-associated macrophage protein)-like metal ion transporter